MAKIGADFFRCLDDIVNRLGAKPVASQLPIGSENQFKGLIDLVRMKGVVWDEETLGAKYHDVEIPADMLDQAKEYREKMIEAAVELDDDAVTAYLEGKEPDEATLKRLIRKAVITGAFYPVLCGSAFKNKGVQPLLDAVVDYLPSPLDVPPIKGIDSKGNEVVRKPDDREPLAMLAFKIMDDPFVGTITFCRIYSGRLESGTGVINSTKDRKERIGRMLLMHANNREDIKEAFAGDIVALAGLKEARTGDTLCDPNKPVILEKMEFPDPVIEIAIEPKSKADQEKLGVALAKLAAEDPSFRVSTDQESGQTILKGVVAGFPVVDVKVQLVDGKYHDVDSSALAFEIASRAAFREALQKGKSVLLEPIMKVEVVTPEDYTGSVIGDLNSRRGQIQGQDMRGNANVINAMVPLMNMFGYVNNLRSMSQGRATFTMQFDHYAEAPANVSAEVQKKFA